MERLLFTCFSILSINALMSQNLTIDEIVKLRVSNFGYLEESLSQKGWTFIKGSDAYEDIYSKATFAYEKSSYSDEAQAFLEFSYNNSENDEICSHRIYLEFFGKEKYTSYLSRLKGLGYKMIKSKIENGNITKVYQGTTTSFLINVIAEKDLLDSTTTRYYLAVVSNVDYFIMFDDDSTLRDLLKDAAYEKKD